MKKIVKERGSGARKVPPQDKEPSARSELAVIQPLWPSADLLIFRKSVLIRVLESKDTESVYLLNLISRTRSDMSCRFVFYNRKF